MKKMDYDYKEKKMVAVLSSKISPDVAINVIGHLSVSVGAYGGFYDQNNFASPRPIQKRWL